MIAAEVGHYKLGDGVALSAEDFIDKLWLLAITLLLIMVSGEELVERGRLEKTRKSKSGHGKSTEFWSPNLLGRLTNRRLPVNVKVTPLRVNACTGVAVISSPSRTDRITR